MSEFAASLVERLDHALSCNPHLFGRKLQCSSESGRVVLSGTVHSYFQKQMAQEAVRHVDGVQRIDNQLEVNWL